MELQVLTEDVLVVEDFLEFVPGHHLARVLPDEGAGLQVVGGHHRPGRPG